MSQFKDARRIMKEEGSSEVNPAIWEKGLSAGDLTRLLAIDKGYHDAHVIAESSKQVKREAARLFLNDLDEEDLGTVPKLRAVVLALKNSLGL